GSMCGKALSSAPYGKLGDEKDSNPAQKLVAAGDEKAFVELVCADQPDPPAYFAYDADLNRRERQTLDEALQRSVVPWSLGRFLEMREAGAQVLDVRDPEEFEKSHLAGSINVGLNGSFATWAGTVLDREREILIIAEPGKEREAALRLGRIGLDRVAGYLEGGAAALAAKPELLRTIRRVLPAEFEKERAAGEVDALVVDVRTPGEHRTASVPGSVLIPLRRFQERIAELPKDRPLVLHCKSGYRSAVAASLLEGAGFEAFRDLVGGFDAWLQETGGEAPTCSA
ncbi:MAG: rhodanese-like domain-containing protein, partial [Planctomycetota bacterium]